MPYFIYIVHLSSIDQHTISDVATHVSADSEEELSSLIITFFYILFVDIRVITYYNVFLDKERSST